MPTIPMSCFPSAKFECRAIAANTLLAAALLTAPLVHAAPVAFNVTGTVASGYDITGEFGYAGRDLTGQTASLAFTLDRVAGAGWQYSVPSGSSSVTLGGVTRQYDLSTNASYGYSDLTNNLSVYGQQYYTYSYYDYWSGTYQTYSEPMYYDQVFGYLGGRTGASSNEYVQLYAYLYSYLTAFVGSGSFDQASSYELTPGVEGYAYFSNYGITQRYDSYWGYSYESYSAQSYFNLTVDRIDVNGGSVPEPGTALLAGLALAGMVLVGRRGRPRATMAIATLVR